MNRVGYKGKVIMLFIGAFILGFIVYNLAIGETIQVWKEVKMYEENLKLLENAPKEIAEIQFKLNSFNTTMQKTMDTSYRNEPLLEFLSPVCRKNNTTLANYISPHVFEQGNFKVDTRTAIIEGGFANLLIILHQMEKFYAWGKVSSAGFSLKEDVRNSQKQLYLTLYIQSVINFSKPTEQIKNSKY